MKTTNELTPVIAPQQIIDLVMEYCEEKGISLIKLCNDHGLNHDLLYRMRKGGYSNPTLKNINQIFAAIEIKNLNQLIKSTDNINKEAA